MLTTIEKVLLLQDLDLFSLATTEHLAQLAALCRESNPGRDEIIFRQADPCSKFYLLVEGKVSLQDGAQSLIVEKCGLDFWSFFAQTQHRMTARAVEECVVLAAGSEDVVDLLTAEPEFCWAILRYLARLSASLLAVEKPCSLL